MSRISPRSSRESRGDPEDALFAAMPAGMSKSRKVAILKSRGLIRQAGRHLEPTPRGSRAIRKRRGA